MMRRITPLIYACMLAALLGACERPEPEHRAMPTSNAKIAVDLLFTHDGVRVYRFADGSRVIYYAVPFKGPVELTEVHNECYSCGKNCTSCSDEYQSSVSVR